VRTEHRSVQKRISNGAFGKTCRERRGKIKLKKPGKIRTVEGMPKGRNGRVTHHQHEGSRAPTKGGFTHTLEKRVQPKEERDWEVDAEKKGVGSSVPRQGTWTRIEPKSSPCRV